MLGATYEAGEGFAVRDVPVPVVGPDDVLLRVTAAAICATDLKIMRHGHRRLPQGRTIVLGHEFVGVVEDVGARVKGFARGDRMGVVPNAGCGDCLACRRNQANYCPDYTAFGIDRDGGHAPYVLIPAQFVAQGNLIPIDRDALSDEQACLLEPLSCVVNCVRQVCVGAGDSVLVYGAGPMGMLIVMMCRAAGASKVLVVEPLAQRRRQILDFGADEAFDPAGDVSAQVRDRTGGQGPDVIILACPAPELQPQALALLAPFGRLCLFAGLPKDAPAVALDTNAIHYRNLTVTGTTGGSADDYRHAMQLAADGRVDLGRVIAVRFPLSRLEEAYRVAAGGAAGKVILLA